MSKNVEAFSHWIQDGGWPTVSCPTCRSGTLLLTKCNTHDSGASIRTRDHEAWEPDWLSGSFDGLYECQSPSCQERVVIAGDYKVGPDIAPNGSWYGEYVNMYLLRFSLPALLLIHPPNGTPDTVLKAIDDASRVVWTDPGSAANRLRVATDELLTARSIPRFRITKGHRTRLTTHARIMLLKATNQLAGDALEAVKWIGNSGSHGAELSVADVLMGAEMFEYALGLIFDKSAAELTRRIRAVNKSKGMPRK